MLAVYELEPLGINGELEANGKVWWYCSDECRQASIVCDFRKVNIQTAWDEEYPADTRCGWCTTPLEVAK